MTKLVSDEMCVMVGRYLKSLGHECHVRKAGEYSIVCDVDWVSSAMIRKFQSWGFLVSCWPCLSALSLRVCVVLTTNDSLPSK